MTRRHDLTIRMGGIALVGAAVGFVGVFAFLADRFNYPDVLDAPAASVLPALLAMGSSGRAVWAVYGLLPLLLVPAAVGAQTALGSSHKGAMRVALQMAVLAAICMMLGLLRWPSIQWELARGFAAADGTNQVALTAIFDGLNRYLGNYLGEFVGELCLNSFFLLVAAALWATRLLPRWVAALGLLSGIVGWIAMWRNVTVTVEPVAALNNVLLPVWLLVLGIGLITISTRRSSHAPMARLE